MTYDELIKEIINTVNQIEDTKVKLDHETDPVQIAELIFRQKELEYIQVSQQEQLKLMKEAE